MIKLLLALLGITGAMVAAALLIGGGTLLWVDTTMTDSEGFINTKPVELETETFAITTPPAQVEIETPGPIDAGALATLRIVAENRDPDKGVFIGVAEGTDLEGYLSDVAYAEIVDMEFEPFETTMVPHPGVSAPQTPSAQAFWTASASGVGPQTLIWDVETGDFGLVLMNEDASAGVEIEAVVGARVPVIRPIGTSLLIAGGIVLAFGTLMIALAL
jgi:hypothetical protein